MKVGKNVKSVKVQLQKSAYYAKGAFQTRKGRQHLVAGFAEYLKANNIQISSIDQIKAKYIISYIQERKEQGKSLRTLQNDMSDIRQTLRSAGRDRLADSSCISNKALGIDGASRIGTKRAITDEQYKEIHQKALQKNPAIAAGMELGRTLGLRSEEIVQSCQSLITWQNALNNGATKLKVVFGTKGGRPRDTTIIDRERTIKAVNTALDIAKQQKGKLINKPNLKQAMACWKNQVARLGLTGVISPHSLRYAYAQDAIQYHQEQGHTKKEALALTSMDLGHGDGRGTYIKESRRYMLMKAKKTLKHLQWVVTARVQKIHLQQNKKGVQL